MNKNRILYCVLFWLLLSFVGAVPYLFFGNSFTDALFESVSGFTATGTSVLGALHATSLQIYQSATQWVGGIAFILMVLVYVFPTEKLHPRRKTTVFWLCAIYILLTAAETVLLFYVSGVDWLNALCVSFSTVSTGGFYLVDSPIVPLFMFLAGVNYIIYIRLAARIANPLQRVFRDEEFRFYVAVILLCSVLLTLYTADDLYMSFTIITGIVSTTKFAFLPAAPLLQFLFILLLFVGASTGSAGGGVKIKRVVLILKNSYNGFRRFLHPNALRPVRFNGKPAAAAQVNNAFLFLVVYISIALIGVLLLALLNVPLGKAFVLVLTSLGNVGYSDVLVLPLAGKYVLMFLMLIGRVELMAFIVLFSRSFWRK
ncbi:Trk system potassium transporter TrkH [Bacteroidia bacterium]|nr:Trk system potassium transporter TrkH [Bacteroidia bacterium]